MEDFSAVLIDVLDWFAGMEKLSASQPTNLVVGGNQMGMGNSSNSSSIVPTSLHMGKDMSLQSVQPWNPKNANETINSNAPVRYLKMM